MLAICGSGGSDSLAMGVVLGAILLWLLVAVVVVRTGRDRNERILLVGLLVLSIFIGPGVYFGVADGFSGDGDDLGKFVLALLIPGAIGAGIALMTGAGNSIKAFLISSWGALFVTGGVYVLFIAFIAIGTACLD